jgi:hypothetical protein
VKVSIFQRYRRRSVAVALPSVIVSKNEKFMKGTYRKRRR